MHSSRKIQQNPGETIFKIESTLINTPFRTLWGAHARPPTRSPSPLSSSSTLDSSQHEQVPSEGSAGNGWEGRKGVVATILRDSFCLHAAAETRSVLASDGFDASWSLTCSLSTLNKPLRTTQNGSGGQQENSARGYTAGTTLEQ